MDSIRINGGRPLNGTIPISGAKNAALPLMIASLLTPAAVMTAVLGVWRLAADLQWASNFAIRNGLFSHWQVWMVSAGLLQTGSHLLNRYGRATDRVA